MFVALVCVEEQEDALVAQVAFAESGFIYAVDLGVREYVTNTLNINNHQVTLCELPREVTKSLGDERLIRVLAAGISPASVVVVLFVLALDEIFSIDILEQHFLIDDLVDVGVHEFDEILAIDRANQLFVELVHDMRAYKLGFNVVFHFLQLIAFRVDVLGNLHHEGPVLIVVLHHECITHCALGEGMLLHHDFRHHLSLLEERFSPVDGHALVFSNIP